MILEQMEQKFKPQSIKNFIINFTRDLTDDEAYIIKVYRKHHTRAMMTIIFAKAKQYELHNMFDMTYDLLIETMYGGRLIIKPELFVKSILTLADMYYQDDINPYNDFEQLTKQAVNDLCDYYIANQNYLDIVILNNSQLSISTDLDNLTAA